jgi:hypothetical protein
MKRRKLCTDEVGGVKKNLNEKKCVLQFKKTFFFNCVLQFKKTFFFNCVFLAIPLVLHFKDDL